MIRVVITIRDAFNGYDDEIEVEVENQFSSAPEHIHLAANEAVKRAVAAVSA